MSPVWTKFVLLVECLPLWYTTAIFAFKTLLRPPSFIVKWRFSCFQSLLFVSILIRSYSLVVISHFRFVSFFEFNHGDILYPYLVQWKYWLNCYPRWYWILCFNCNRRLDNDNTGVAYIFPAINAIIAIDCAICDERRNQSVVFVDFPNLGLTTDTDPELISRKIYNHVLSHRSVNRLEFHRCVCSVCTSMYKYSLCTT